MKEQLETKKLSVRNKPARLIIIGASGSIGHQLYNDCVMDGRQVFGTCFQHAATDLIPFDITSQNLEDLFPNLGPGDCIYLLSAITNPNWVFNNPQKARQVNVTAAINLIDRVLQSDARLVFLSSTMVFDGVTGDYQEDHPTAPATVYGRQKVEIEQHLHQNQGNWCVVRTDSIVTRRLFDNCPVEKTYQTLFNGEAKMASDNRFSLTDAADLSLVLRKLADQPLQGVYHAIGSPPVIRSQLADWIKQYSRFGQQMSFSEVPYSDIPYPEPRPQNSFLNNSKIMRELEVIFSPPEDAVRRKVSLIDNHIAAKGPWWQ